MAGFAPAAVVEGPDRLPLPFGLFSVVSLAEESTERWENGVTWEALSCDPVNIVVGDCDAPEGFPKQFPEDGPGFGEATAFTVYGTWKCTPVGGPSRGQEKAREVLLAREQNAVEGRLWQKMAQDASAETLTTGGDALQSLAVAEQYIADTYGSLGVIHASRAATTFLAKQGRVHRHGGRLETELGTPVVAGGGYPGSGLGTFTPGVDDEPGTWAYATPTAGSEFIAASPAMFGYRSEIFEPTLISGDLLDRSRNDLYGVAERNYLIGYDVCGVAFIETTLGAL